jgi:ribonucleotide reductase beta subunit family protein with ferritin-like domain
VDPWSRRGKTNFFERRVGDYQKAGVMSGLSSDNHAIAFDEDF